MAEQSPHRTSQGRARLALDTLASILVIVVALVVLYQTWKATRHPAAIVGARAARPASAKVSAVLPAEPLPLDGAAILGSRTARVGIIEFSDFQCPYCKKFARETLPELRKKYIDPGNVLLAFRHFPLETIHPQALKAAESAECAERQDQGKFWVMHDRLFGPRPAFDEATLRDHARIVGLDGRSFATCLAGQTVDKIRSDSAAAQALAIQGTPTFFFGMVEPEGRLKAAQRFSGAQPFAQFQDVLDRLVAATPAAK